MEIRSSLRLGMFEDLCSEFRERFGSGPEFAARAPGRINLIGEHTDYNEGLVLPLAVDLDTWAVAALRGGSECRVHSRERGETLCFDAATPARTGGWIDYVQGVVFALAERGMAPGGFDLALASDLPQEAGLSSSAALGVAVITVLDAAAELGMTAFERAELAHRAEAHFVGVGCGTMDSLASAMGRRGSALRIDCRSEEIERVPLPVASVGLLVADSGVRRRLAGRSGSGYAARRRQCAEAVGRAREAGVGPRDLEALRDLGPGDLPQLEAVLEPLHFRRARHVILENERVDATCRALAKGDLAGVGACLRAGMASLRDDFEVSTPELDLLCQLADAEDGVYGSRLTGAGFGGCTLHLVVPEVLDHVADSIAEGFARGLGRRPNLLTLSSEDGASAFSL